MLVRWYADAILQLEAPISAVKNFCAIIVRFPSAQLEPEHLLFGRRSAFARVLLPQLFIRRHCNGLELVRRQALLMLRMGHDGDRILGEIQQNGMALGSQRIFENAMQRHGPVCRVKRLLELLGRVGQTLNQLVAKGLDAAGQPAVGSACEKENGLRGLLGIERLRLVANSLQSAKVVGRVEELALVAQLAVDDLLLAQMRLLLLRQLSPLFLCHFGLFQKGGRLLLLGELLGP